ncbi:hypothetical protein Tco_0565342 [Tanacetum coccineum]
MEDPEQAIVGNTRARYQMKAREGLVSEFTAYQTQIVHNFKSDFKRQQGEMTNKIDTVLKAITGQIAGTLPSDMVKNLKLGTHPVSPSPNAELVCTKEEDGDVMFIEIIPKDDNSHKEGPEAGVQEVEYFDIFPTRSELAYHKYLMCGPIPSIFLRNPIIIEGCPSNLKIPCNIGHVHDIGSITDPRLSQVVLGKPFVEISNMTHDPPEGVVRFTNGTDEISYKMPHKIEQYNLLSDFKKKHTKSVYLRNDEDKRRGVEYVMSKILGFYKECLELGPEYLTGVADEGEVT